jgi:hypothetical protein
VGVLRGSDVPELVEVVAEAILHTDVPTSAAAHDSDLLASRAIESVAAAILCELLPRETVLRQTRTNPDD